MEATRETYYEFQYKPTPEVDEKLLKSGDESEIKNQLKNWLSGYNNSILVECVPDEFIEGNIDRDFFSNCGEVNYVEFIPTFNVQNQKSDNMAIIHFHRFLPFTFPERVTTGGESHSYVCRSDTIELITDIISRYPEPVEVNWGTKNYILKCSVNTHPKSNYTYMISQLNEKLESLQRQLVAETEEKERMIRILTVTNSEMLNMKEKMNSLYELITRTSHNTL